MFHDQAMCVVILAANGWPGEDRDITHSLASVSIHVYQQKILNAQEKQENFICINYRNFMKAKLDMHEFTVEKNLTPVLL